MSRAFSKLEISYRLHIARGIVEQLLEEHKYTIGIREYDECLGQDPMAATRDRWGEIIPAKPSWLNDYYFAAALEALAKKEAVIKAIQYSVMSWPPRSEIYRFSARNTELTVSEETFIIETNSKCAAYQAVPKCSQPDRIEWESHAETVSARKTQIKNTYKVKEGASPCERCWEKEERESDIRVLVANIVKYDLADLVTREISGENGEFKAAIVGACIGSQCAAEPDMIRTVVTKAVELRKQQMALRRSPGRHEYSNEETDELKATLKEYIESLPT